MNAQKSWKLILIIGTFTIPYMAKSMSSEFTGKLDTWKSKRFPWISIQYPECWSHEPGFITSETEPVVFKPTEQCKSKDAGWKITMDAFPSSAEREPIKSWLSPENKTYHVPITGIRGNSIQIFQGDRPKQIYWYAAVGCPGYFLRPVFEMPATPEQIAESIKGRHSPPAFTEFVRHIKCNKDPKQILSGPSAIQKSPEALQRIMTSPQNDN